MKITTAKAGIAIAASATTLAPFGSVAPHALERPHSVLRPRAAVDIQCSRDSDPPPFLHRALMVPKSNPQPDNVPYTKPGGVPLRPSGVISGGGNQGGNFP